MADRIRISIEDDELRVTLITYDDQGDYETWDSIPLTEIASAIRDLSKKDGGDA